MKLHFWIYLHFFFLYIYFNFLIEKDLFDTNLRGRNINKYFLGMKFWIAISINIITIEILDL